MVCYAIWLLIMDVPVKVMFKEMSRGQGTCHLLMKVLIGFPAHVLSLMIIIIIIYYIIVLLYYIIYYYIIIINNLFKVGVQL